MASPMLVMTDLTFQPRRHLLIAHLSPFTMSITLTSLRPFRLVRPTLITLTLSLRASSTSTAPPAPPPTRTCPSCSSSLSLTTSPCPSCSTLLPLPPSLSHHSILGFSTPIPISTSLTTFDVPSELATLPAHGYTIDPRDVRGRMLQKQKELHPDKYTNQGEKIVALARELSGRVNGAYGTLADPLKRAEYIVGYWFMLSITSHPLSNRPSISWWVE